MSAEVVDIASRRYDPHLEGEAWCTACCCEFHCVQPVGSAEPFECPSCGNRRAFRKYICLAAEGETTWRCNCGSEVFYVVVPSAMAREAEGDQVSESWLTCVGCGRVAHSLGVFSR